MANFVGCEVDGTLPIGGGLQYGLLYDQLRGRFLISYNASPWVSVGTPRPNDIKALSDNIRVRNSPVAVGLYSGYTDIVVANSTTETTLTPSTGAIGSMFLQAPQPLGMTIDQLHRSSEFNRGGHVDISAQNGCYHLALHPGNCTCCI